MRLIKGVWKISIEEFLIYRLTSFFTFILAAVFFGVELVAGHVYFGATGNVGGWTETKYQLLIATVSSMVYLYNIFFIVGHENMSEDILAGNLDYTLLRPVSSYWFTSMSRIDIPSVFNLALSGAVIIVLLVRGQFDAIGTVLYFVAFLVGVVLFFLLNKLILTCTFWLDGFTALGGIMEDSIDFLSRPAAIFPKLIRGLFTVIIPILLITNLPVQALQYSRTVSYWLVYALVFEFSIYQLSKWFWRQGIKHYFSAN